MTHESEAYVVGAGPLAVVNDGVNDFWLQFFTSENLEHLGFGEMGVVEHHGKDVRMPFGQQRAGNAGGTPPRESYFLPERKLRQAGHELLFGHAL